MKFGKVEQPELIDFTLPTDHPDTAVVLAKNSNKENLNVYVGCAKWNRQDLKNFYPRGTKDELVYYASQFNSIELNATFYNFDFSTQFVYSLGGHSYDNRYAGLMSNSQVGNTNYSVDIRDSWKAAGDITDVPKIQNGVNPQVNSASSRFVTSTDHLALNNFRIGYTLPKQYIDKAGLSGLNMWISGDNLFLLSKRKGFDPRISQTGANSVYNYGQLSTITLGLRVKL